MIKKRQGTAIHFKVVINPIAFAQNILFGGLCFFNLSFVIMKSKFNQFFSFIHKNFEQVKHDHATCLTPIKLFFQEFYAVTNINDELFFEFIKRLNDNSYLLTASALNFELNKNLVEFPFYSTEQLNEQIKAERLPYYKD